MQGAKEQTSEAMSRAGRNESPGRKHDFKLIHFGFHNLAVHRIKP